VRRAAKRKTLFVIGSFFLLWNPKKCSHRAQYDELPAAVSGGLVCDLPDTVDSEQIVEVNPSTELV
jgi:hypothetical protein